MLAAAIIPFENIRKKRLYESHNEIFIVFSKSDLAFATKPAESGHNLIFFQFGCFLYTFETECASVSTFKSLVNFAGPGSN